jgi:hypothetical protein
VTDANHKTHAPGYRQPPVATRFKPGESGNPRGRPKGSRNFATAIEKELNARLAVTENGKRRTITKRQAVAKQLVNKAISGDPRALPTLLNETRHHENQTTAAAGIEIFNTPDDAVVLASIVRRARATADPEGPPGPRTGSTAEAAPSISPRSDASCG